MRAVARQHLVPELLSQGHLLFEHFARQQPFDEVVVATVAVASREAEHAGDRVRLEHRPHDVRLHAEPVDRLPVLALEVERRERAVDADSLEHPFGRLGVLGEDSPRARARCSPEPGVVARQDEREPLVDSLEDLTPFVEEVAPAGVVVGDARVEHDVVASARHRDRVVLEGAEPAEVVEHCVVPSFERPRRREQLARNEEAPRVVRGDLHGQDAIRSSPAQ